MALKRVKQPWLVIATDFCLWATLVAVAIGFGGRMVVGQVALVIGASLTAFCWMLYQCTSTEPRYVWTGSEWLWCAGILVCVAQIVPLPGDLMLKISPQIKEILPFWYDKELAGVLPASWNQLSLAPWETTSALAVFVAYAMLFIVAAQRTRTIHDVETMLCRVSIAVIVMMVFAQVQFIANNGKFYWLYDHPYMTTETYPLGCFTTRNHLAQFMALGTGPLLWWLLRRLQQQELDRAERKAIPASMHSMAVTILLTSLVGIVLTALMTLSRGGTFAIGLAAFCTMIVMYRIGLASLKFLAAMLLVGGITSSLFSFSKYEAIMVNRLEQQTTGRSEIWQANIAVAKDFPILGTGIGTHADSYYLHIDSKRDDGAVYSHAESGYLQIASECGVVGLIVCALFIITSFWWCLGSLWNKDTKVTSASAAILASLTANVIHAIGDFFWYIPVCMLLLGFQLACAARLYRLTRQDAGRFVFSFPLPRIITVGAMCGLVPLAMWMFDMRWSAALAEFHFFESVILSNTDEKDLGEEEQKRTGQERVKEVLLAAKINPRDARLQEAASDAYTQLFDYKQQDTENTMSLLMLRDAVKSSEFESVKAANEWLSLAVGSNAKILKLAARSLKRALANSPLRAKAYVQMAELSFLDTQDDVKLQDRCLMQSLKLRPRDSDMMYYVGKLRLQEGNVEQAMEYWRPAFQRSPKAQERIALILAGQVEPDFFLKEFTLDSKALQITAAAFGNAGRERETRQMQRLFIHKAMEEAKTMETNEDLEQMLIDVRNACRELDDIPAAANVLLYGVKRLPQSYSIHYMLSLDLIGANRTADAAEHLKWCASRRPDDMNLRKMTQYAVTERLKQKPGGTQTATTADRKSKESEHPSTFR